MNMKIWVDADACPGAVKDIIVTAAHRRKVETCFVANKMISVPSSPMISTMQVDMSPDAADRLIESLAVKGDLVITQDIPLAHALVQNAVTVINPRGEAFTPENIGERLSMRNLMQDVRDAGELTGGPKAFGEKEKRAFASMFDKELTRLLRASNL
ncbi:YaiI/YqxD family protein [Candidatus Obscuribacterales bacterium]|nr:YaiI/YqxD family protein [Candidatus Obscuribacterales bacterium]